MSRYWLGIISLVVMLVSTACGSSSTPAPTPEPQDLLTQLIANLEAQTTLRFIVEHSGAPYFIYSSFGDMALKRAEGQYADPNRIGARVKVLVGQLPVEVEVYAVNHEQYMRGIWTNNTWLQDVLVEGFDARNLLSTADNGFRTALSAVKGAILLEDATLEDGTVTYHLKGKADGALLSGLVVNLITMTGEVDLDMYIDKANLLPLRFVAVEGASVNADQPEPRTWTIDLYDFGQPDALEGPAASAETAATAEATPNG